MDPLPTSKPGGTAPVAQDFTTKEIEQPILDPGAREKISADIKSGSSGSGLKNFYRANKFYIWAIVAGLAIISALAFFVLRKPPVAPLKEANVEVVLTAPETVASGGEEVYKIKVQNNDPQKLVNLELELAYPDGVVFAGSSPQAANLSGTSFKVPDLISGQNAVLMVKTRISGNINDQKKINVRLHYRYSNFNSEFIKEQQFTVRLTASDVALEINGPSTANNAQLIVYEIKYKNNSGQDVKGARVKVTFPAGFNFAQSQPLPDMGNNVWNIGTVPAGKDGVITAQGSFSNAVPGESKNALAEFLVLGQDGQYFAQSTANFITTFSALPLLVSQELQDYSSGGYVVKPGDRLNYLVKYQNNASTAVSGVNIILTLDSKALDLSALQAEGAEVSGNTLAWNAASIPNLAGLNPSDAGQLSFSVEVKNPATRDASKNLTVVSSIKIKSNEYETYFPGNQLTLKVSSPVTLSSRLDFQSGSLPPQVGKATVYKVRISLKNSSNDYSDGSLTAFIPGNGFVSGSVNASEAGKTVFDPATGKLSWNFGSLPAHTGVFSQPKILEFSVKLNPAASQKNQSPTLVKDISFGAKDLFTGETAAAKLDDLTTSDISGQNNWENGTVLP